MAKRLRAAGVRAEVQADNEPMRVKIAKAQQQKVPYMLVIGDKEIENDSVGVRERTQGRHRGDGRGRVRRSRGGPAP